MNKMQSDLKQKADSGDAKACLEYGLLLFNEQKNNNIDSNQKLEIWSYINKCFLLSRDDKDTQILILKHFSLIEEIASFTGYSMCIPETRKLADKFYYIYAKQCGLNNDDKELKWKLLSYLVDLYYCFGPNDIDNYVERSNHICNDCLKFFSLEQAYADKSFYGTEYPRKWVLKATSILFKNTEHDSERKELLDIFNDGLIELLDQCFEDNALIINKRDIEQIIKNAHPSMISSYEKRDYYEAIKCLCLGENGSKEKMLNELMDLIFYSSNQLLFCFIKTKLVDAYYRNKNGDSFNISKAYRSIYGMSNLEFKRIVDDIENQKQLDDTHSKIGDVLAIPPLLEAIKNANKLIYSNIEESLKVTIDKKIKAQLDNINVVFSYKKEEEKYEPTAEDIIDAIKEIEEILKPFSGSDSAKLKKALRSLREYLSNFGLVDVPLELFQKIHDSSEWINDGNKLYRPLHSFFNLLEPSTYSVYGDYSYSDNRIVLYLTNIYNKCKNPSDELTKEIYLLGTYAHEMFHAFHHFTSKGKPGTGRKTIDSIVEESLASYFQYYFVKNNFPYYGPSKQKISSYDNMFKRLNTRIIPLNEIVSSSIEYNWWEDMFIYPYSGAKYMKRQNDQSRNNALFRMVYNKSINSFADAFDLLKLFYKLEMD